MDYKALITSFFFLLLISTSGVSQTIEQLREQIDSVGNSETSSSIIADDELFNVIKTTFDQSKISHNSTKIADSLFDIGLYKSAILEYKRAKFYSISKENNSYLDFQIVTALHLNGEYSKSNYHIESIQIKFDFLQLTQQDYNISLMYLKNGIELEDYSRVFLLAESALENLELTTEQAQKFTKYYELCRILSGKVSDVSQLDNHEGKLVLQAYLETSTKNPDITYYLSTFIPGSGYLYNGNYKMATISALVNIPLAIYLGSRIVNISKGIQGQDQTKIVVNSLDFLLIYNFVFSRYWKGARNQAVIETKEINKIRKATTVKELKGVYNND